MTQQTENRPPALKPALDSMTLLVAAVIVHDKATNRVVLLQRSENAKFAQGMWDLPVGKSEPGEPITETAVRELYEETGLTVKPESLKVAHIIHGAWGVEAPNGFLTAPVDEMLRDGVSCRQRREQWRLRKRGRWLSYSVGMTVTEQIHRAVLKVPAPAWTASVEPCGDIRDGAWAAEITGDCLKGWPKGMRLIVRKERPHSGAQLRITDAGGLRLPDHDHEPSRGVTEPGSTAMGDR